MFIVFSHFKDCLNILNSYRGLSALPLPVSMGLARECCVVGLLGPNCQGCFKVMIKVEEKNERTWYGQMGADRYSSIGMVQFAVRNVHEYAYYFLDLSVGTPPQRVSVIAPCLERRDLSKVKGYSTSMSEYLQTISIFQLLSLETSGGYWKQHYSFPLPDMQVFGRNHIHLKIKVKVLSNAIVDIQIVVTGAVEATLTRSTTSPKAALLAGTNAVDLAVFSSYVQHASKTKHRQVRIAYHLLAQELRT